MVQSKADPAEGQAHSGSSECNCRQAISSRADHLDGVAPLLGDF